MAYRGTNLLLREQRRADLDRAREQMQFQNIQQAMGAAEDIRNRQFDRQRQQAELHGRLAEQLMMKREPFTQVPHEEAAQIGAMSAKTEREKMLGERQREDELIRGQRKHQTDRDVRQFGRAKKLAGIRSRGGGIGDFLKNSISAAELDVKHKHRDLQALLKVDWNGKPVGTPEQIEQAQQNHANAQNNLVNLSEMADTAGREGKGEMFRRLLESQTAATPPSGPPKGSTETETRQVAPPSITSQPSIELYKDPVRRAAEERKRWVEGRVKLAKAKEEMAKEQNYNLLLLQNKVKSGELINLDDLQMEYLAAQYLKGDDKVRAQIDRIVDTVDEKSWGRKFHGPPEARDKFENALINLNNRRQGAQPPQGPTAAPTQAPAQQGPASVQYAGDDFERVMAERKARRGNK